MLLIECDGRTPEEVGEGVNKSGPSRRRRIEVVINTVGTDVECGFPAPAVTNW